VVQQAKGQLRAVRAKGLAAHVAGFDPPAGDRVRRPERSGGEVVDVDRRDLGRAGDARRQHLTVRRHGQFMGILNNAGRQRQGQGRAGQAVGIDAGQPAGLLLVEPGRPCPRRHRPLPGQGREQRPRRQQQYHPQAPQESTHAQPPHNNKHGLRRPPLFIIQATGVPGEKQRMDGTE